MYKRHIKPLADVVLALLMLVLLTPMLVMVMAAVILVDGRPIFFVQKRTGKNMKKFNLLKFRTLVPKENGDLSITHRQVIRTGNFLRKTGIDELPQLVNILRGEMSFIGPRPLPEVYDQNYLDSHKRRFAVKAGITGWAQVHGRNTISWNERFELDNWYVTNQSLLTDLKILGMTIGQLFKHPSDRPMPVFKGQNG